MGRACNEKGGDKRACKRECRDTIMSKRKGRKKGLKQCKRACNEKGGDKRACKRECKDKFMSERKSRKNEKLNGHWIKVDKRTMKWSVDRGIPKHALAAPVTHNEEAHEGVALAAQGTHEEEPQTHGPSPSPSPKSQNIQNTPKNEENTDTHVPLGGILATVVAGSAAFLLGIAMMYLVH